VAHEASPLASRIDVVCKLSGDTRRRVVVGHVAGSHRTRVSSTASKLGLRRNRCTLS
jgi:hypothetical protein